MNYFSLKELFPKEIYNKFSEEELSKKLDPNLISTLNDIKYFFNAIIIINTWSFSQSLINKYGLYNERGYRDQSSLTGAKRSPHKEGKAADFDIWEGSKRLDPSFVRETIVKNLSVFKNIKGIELNTEWIHIDLRDRSNNGKVCLFNASGSILKWV